MEFLDILENAKKFAEGAGEILIESYEKKIKFSTKSTNADIVTEADIKSESYIIKNIKEKYPEHAVLSEEKGSYGDSDYVWVLDPLDGTTNYFHGLPYFAVSIGVMYKGEPVVGVVYAPKLNEMFWAAKGSGAYYNGKKVNIKNVDKIKDAMVATGFPYDSLISKENGYDLFDKVVKLAKNIRLNGSASLDICYVACGRLDAYWHIKLCLWDIAAAQLILKEAGGDIIKTNTVKENGEDAINVIAGSKSICQEIQNLFK